ncbi:MAG: nucleotidyltransferase [Deltaproteobacteria bacterium]|nr:nucleotidyltransferase [Deltaproteobacteria bacterium]
MATVEQIIHEHLTALNLTKAQRAQVNQAQDTLNKLLRERFDPQGEVEQGGSVCRSTVIRPPKDVDLLVVLSAKKFPTVASLSPNDVMERVRAELAPLGLNTRVQNRSLGLVYEGMDFDLVLCWRDPKESHVLYLPDLARHKWLRTSPAEHERIGEDRDRAAKGFLRPLIRGMKAWNVAHGKPLRSFHIEVMMWEVWKNDVPKTWAEGLLLSFFRLAERVLRPTADPAGKGPIVDEGLTPPNAPTPPACSTPRPPSRRPCPPWRIPRPCSPSSSAPSPPDCPVFGTVRRDLGAVAVGPRGG